MAVCYADMRALALDPDETRLGRLVETLESMGFHSVYAARNTEEARDQVFFNPCHLVVMGSDQRPCPAESVIQAVRRDTRVKTGVLLLQTGDTDEAALIEAGADRVLAGDASGEAIGKAVAALLKEDRRVSAPQPARRRAARQGLA